jgi:DNA-binding NtrC family response regulator
MSDGDRRHGRETGEPKAVTGPGHADTRPGDTVDSDGQKIRLLILEGEAADAELAQCLLAGAGIGFTAVVVDTGASFVEQLAAFRPDIILSDFRLPGFSGETALEIAQEQCPDVPFVVWSGVLGGETAVELIKKGASDYIPKDRPARLPSAISNALAEAEHRARLARIEDQVFQAQRLASLGQLTAAEEVVSLTRQLLAAVRREITGERASPSAAAGPPG